MKNAHFNGYLIQIWKQEKDLQILPINKTRVELFWESTAIFPVKRR